MRLRDFTPILALVLGLGFAFWNGITSAHADDGYERRALESIARSLETIARNAEKCR